MSRTSYNEDVDKLNLIKFNVEILNSQKELKSVGLAVDTTALLPSGLTQLFGAICRQTRDTFQTLSPQTKLY